MVYPNPQIFHHLKAIFVHIPKTGGTSIERTLRESPHQVVGGHTTALGYQRKFPVEFAEYFTFSVVRHPVTRFCSAWRYLREMPVQNALHNAGIHECDSFESWMERLCGNPGLIEGIVHLHPQNLFVCDREGAVLVDRVFHYESLDSAWVEICSRLGLSDKPLPRLNASVKPAPNLTVSDNHIAWITDAYAEDFRLGNYDPDPSAVDPLTSMCPPH